MKHRFLRFGLVVLLSFGAMTATACDKEDRKDVKQIGNDVEEGAEDAGKEVEDAVDEADTDGKDD